ncbi:hypothetical protein GCM10011588_35160 [Nocardia jinanensis]|uniref:Uncharacterized protein n=1 Tax=Nocardia jinanensis TaxID=382504 RepID=A0A917RPG8_9NOCA|nr:hypothetical protein GCM10011588_35160 [Nocardia jinanensis]
MNKEVVRRFYRAALRAPGGPDSAAHTVGCRAGRGRSAGLVGSDMFAMQGGYIAAELIQPVPHRVAIR